MRKAVALLSILSGLAVGSPAQSLFAPASAASGRDASRPWVVRSRAVRIQLGRIPGASASDALRGVLPPGGHRLVLNLFGDVSVRARMTRSEREGPSFVWVGKVEGQPFGDVVLSVHDGILAGSVVSPRGAFRIRFDGRRQVVEELDEDAFQDGGCFREAAPPAEAADAPMADDGSQVDVLVAYTPSARAAAGGTSGMLSQIDLAVAETNTGYQNSGVVQRLHLAGAVEVSYAESGDIGMDLDRVTCLQGQACNGQVLDPDGYLDTVPALRDAYHADVVSLITETPGSPYCGIAWLMAGNDPGFAPNAYSVVERSCMTGYYSFGHEIGHNMGLNHARTDPVGTGAFSYSFGYKWTGYRTVMAYAPGTRVLYFSNPNVLHLGQPTGVSETSASSAYNALSLDNTRATVANFRGGTTPGIRVSAPNGGESWSAGSDRTVTWTATSLPAGAVVQLGCTSPSGTIYLAAVPATQGSYGWRVPALPGSSWRIKACVKPAPSSPTRRTKGGSSACLASDTSDAPFTITP
jgi:peptidyl-Asp metalloendopeptidase